MCLRGSGPQESRQLLLPPPVAALVLRPPCIGTWDSLCTNARSTVNLPRAPCCIEMIPVLSTVCFHHILSYHRLYQRELVPPALATPQEQVQRLVRRRLNPRMHIYRHPMRCTRHQLLFMSRCIPSQRPATLLCCPLALVARTRSSMPKASRCLCMCRLAWRRRILWRSNRNIFPR